MRYASLSLLMLLLLSSCTKKPYEAQWDRPDSALDPVGLSEHKKDARERASQSKFKKGEQVTLRNTKTMVFEQNPETNFSVSGSPVSSDSGVVLEPGPLFLKVELKNGFRGFINVSDIVDPSESNSFGLLPVGANVLLPPMHGGDEEMPSFLKAVEDMPSSSLEPALEVLPFRPASAQLKQQDVSSVQGGGVDQGKPVITPSLSSPTDHTKTAEEMKKEALIAPVVVGKPSVPFEAKDKVDDSLPPPSAETAE